MVRSNSYRNAWPMFKLAPEAKSIAIINPEVIASLKQQLLITTDDDLGAWSDVKRKLKAAFASLDDNDLYLCEGWEEDMLTKILQKIGIENLEKLEKIIKS
jgi:hypothetical protein